MGKIFNLSFVILCAVFPEEMVVASDDNLELSSVPHRRQKRMNHQPGSSSSSSHDLRPIIEDNLKRVNIDNPTLVEIVSGDSTHPGYAIHPYFVLTRLAHTLQGFRVFAHMKNSGLLEHQRVRSCLGEEFREVVLIQLTKPIIMDNPVPRAFSAEHYEKRDTDWAKAEVKEWIRLHRPHMQPQPQQSLSELRLYDPTKVVMTKNGVSIGPGFAIHPHIVITSRNFIQITVGVFLYPATRGQLKPHRVQNYYLHADIGVVRLQDPILLTMPVPTALVNEHYSIEGVAFATGMAQDWIREFHEMVHRMRHPAP